MGIKQDTHLADDEDDLDDAERARLHAALQRSLEDIRAGRVHNARAVIAELRGRRSVHQSHLEVGIESLDTGRGIDVDEGDLDRYLSSLAPRRE